MSWQERLEDIQFTIKTGDGKIFTPLWKNGTKTKVYNFSKYDFIDVDKSFIDRKKPQSGKYPLVFWFQGDDNIEQSETFERSADDPRLWEIKHPFYGNITGQPVSISRDDTNFNVTEITVEFWESITGTYPNPTSSFEDVIVDRTATLAEVAAENYDLSIKPKLPDILILLQSIIAFAASAKKLLTDVNNAAAKYTALVNKAVNDVNNLISSPLDAIKSLQALVLTPFLLVASVKSRINSLKEAFNGLIDIFDGNYSDLNTKLYFEAQAATIIGSMCSTAATPGEGDYVTKTDIESVNTDIVDIYNQYLETLDNAQVDISDVDNAFHADALVQSKLYDLVTETTGNLFSLAFSAKQERTVEVDRNTNIVLLTHKYLGLDANDENIENFRQLNEIKNDELLLIKKGRTIKFFV